MSLNEFHFLALVVLGFCTFAAALIHGRSNTLDRSPRLLDE